MIAFTFALPTESRTFANSLSHDEQERCTIFHTGVGETECRRRITPLLDSQRPDRLVSSGFAGSVSDELEVGDLVIARNHSNPKLAEIAARSLRGRVLIKNLWTTQSIVDDAYERRQLAARHDAAAIDMETAVIAAECAVRSIPFLSLRVISDSPRHPFPAPSTVLFDVARQRTPIFTLAAYLARHPASLSLLLKFQRQIALAEKRLAAALLEVLRELNRGRLDVH